MHTYIHTYIHRENNIQHLTDSEKYNFTTAVQLRVGVTLAAAVGK